MRQRPKPLKPKAKLPVARKSPKNQSARVRDLEKRLAEALDQQTATSEILRVIASSPTNVQPVFDAIAQSARRLLSGLSADVTQLINGELHLVAFTSVTETTDDALRAVFPSPLDRPGVHTAAARDKVPFIVIDSESDDRIGPRARDVFRARGYRAGLAVPMLQYDGRVIGAIAVTRRNPGRFTDDEIALLQTFAAQAVIAINNVRLFNETKEGLEQQTATSEILRAISSSPTDLQPVLDAVAERAARLCSADDVKIHLVDGDTLRLAAQRGPIPSVEARPIIPTRHIGRAVLERQTIHVHDMRTALDQFPDAAADVLTYGPRTSLATPLLREGVAIGVIQIRRLEVKPFAEKQIALLETFADQAVIAIQNMRLFKELEARNSALTESLEQQTATSEILRVISGSPTDVQPVFDTIVRSAVTLCDGLFSGLYQFDGELIRPGAQHNYTPEALEEMHRIFPMRPTRTLAVGRAILERAVVHIPDIDLDPEWQHPALSHAIGFRGGLFVPMLREGAPIGVVAVTRAEPGPFSDSEIELLKTFADQAVIAIENVRLFTELQASNRELTTALDTQTATSDILRVMSHAQTDVQPVFDTILASAVRLLQGYSGVVTRVAGDQLDLAALTRTTDAGDAAVRALYPERLDSQATHVRATRNRAPLNIADAHSDPQLPEVEHTRARVRGYRSHVVVPLLRQDEAIGTIGVTRRDPGGFTDDEIALLQTFADQAVIAIENVRLFKELEASNREIAEKSRQIEVASQHKSEFLANMSHELRTPLNAIIGFSEVLSERMFGDLNEKQEEYLKDINASGSHLLSLINDILDLSKIEAGRMELELTDFHLPTALDNALMLVRERAGRRSIALHTSIDNRLGQIQGDERKIRQVVLNLLSNAIKFTPEGGRIEIAAMPKDGSVEVSVSDTGVGIAPEDQEAVFEEFRQVGTAAKKVEGTGLGLTLCRKFIELHGGRIWVKSQVDAGSTFTFTIPVRRGE